MQREREREKKRGDIERRTKYHDAKHTNRKEREKKKERSNEGEPL